jgi:hypothetical protein
MVLAGGSDEYLLGCEHAIGLLDMVSEVTAWLDRHGFFR